MRSRLETCVGNPAGLPDIQEACLVVNAAEIRLAFPVGHLMCGYYKSAVIVPQPDTQGNIYETGKKTSDEDFAKINIKRNVFHGEWNYTIKPNFTSKN